MVGVFPMSGRTRLSFVEVMKDAGGEAHDSKVDVKVFHGALYATEEGAATTATPPRRQHSFPKGAKSGEHRKAEMKALREALAGWRWI